MEIRLWIELAAAFTMATGIAGLIANRIKTDKGIGVRAIQFAGIVMLPPVVLILALEGVMDGSAVGTIVGALVGYLFSEFANRPSAKDE